MKGFVKLTAVGFIVFGCLLNPVRSNGQGLIPDTSYLSGLKSELRKMWPANRTINLVFHGHSVPAGYWSNHEVHTRQSYPYLLLKKLKEKYPYSVINIIVTAIGGENSIKGQARMDKVLAHEPDVLIIDYALNDVPAGLEKANEAWEKMIREALKRKVKVILLTPSPDQRVNIIEKGNALELHADQIRKLAAIHNIALTDSFSLFKEIAEQGGKIGDYMSHVNHPNERGHEIIADALMKWF